ncbi:helix-turn-helix domain-containing protein [Streptomyces sp. SL294]|uniref:helix-turn-helix domain-containing protein n=1 Tax=Streptomyces sp. SL294 TaxID=2995144 RepID=UPI0022731F0E|nr:helix-turn-helix domain-containing protein [Streptomyces sp. SL294]MCY1676889.1 helix-turn-helix domain-containing protein [Streptomyces sp. SL294]
MADAWSSPSRTAFSLPWATGKGVGVARPERPVIGPPHLESLALYLRSYRDKAAVTYEEMAQHVDASSATLKRTASGKTVPKWAKVEQFHRAIRKTNDIRLYTLDPAAQPPDYLRVRSALIDLWTQARREERNTLDVTPIRPEDVTNTASFKYALYALYESKGAPPLREVQAWGGETFLPLSSLARIVSKQTLPADDRQLVALLYGLGRGRVSNEWRDRWLEARARANAPDAESGTYLLRVADMRISDAQIARRERNRISDYDIDWGEFKLS